jgi:hypothetical protein
VARALKKGCWTASRVMATENHPKACQAPLSLSPAEELSAVIAALHLQGLETDHYLV